MTGVTPRCAPTVVWGSQDPALVALPSLLIMSSVSFVNGYGTNGVAHAPNGQNGEQAHPAPYYANGASTSNGYVP